MTLSCLCVYALTRACKLCPHECITPSVILKLVLQIFLHQMQRTNHALHCWQGQLLWKKLPWKCKRPFDSYHSHEVWHLPQKEAYLKTSPTWPWWQVVESATMVLPFLPQKMSWRQVQFRWKYYDPLTLCWKCTTGAQAWIAWTQTLGQNANL